MESQGKKVKEEGCDGMIKEAEMQTHRKTEMEEPGRTVRRKSVTREDEYGVKGEKAPLESKGQWRTWRSHQKQQGKGDTALGSLQKGQNSDRLGDGVKRLSGEKKSARSTTGGRRIDMDRGNGPVTETQEGEKI